MGSNILVVGSRIPTSIPASIPANTPVEDSENPTKMPAGSRTSVDWGETERCSKTSSPKAEQTARCCSNSLRTAVDSDLASPAIFC